MIAMLFVLLLVLLLLGVPIFFSLSLASAITIWNGDLTDMVVVVQQIFNSINSFPLMAIPFFLLAGSLMQHGGISQRLVNFANSLVGNMSGGLALVAIVTSMFFAAISGSGAATTAAVGAILIPAMVDKKYDLRFATANQSAAGALGIIIPPSIPMILYGIAAGTSVGDMFIAGIIPGIVVTLSLAIYAYIYSKKNGYKGDGEKGSIKDVLVAGRKAILAILMPVIVLGGIYGGIFTPTEAAVVAVVYSFVVGLFVYREITFKKFVNILVDSAITTAIILGIIGGAGLFSRVMQLLNVPEVISNAVLSTIDSPIVFLLLVNLILLIAGMFIEAAAAILMLVPILLPIALQLGIDPVHFGIIMIVNLAIGMFTPPVGLNLFVASEISGVSVARLTKPIIPFVLVMIVALLVITFIPELSTWLPSLLK
ncbi:TRAP transporter large permease [Oceanobacillus alkalisoli]|uniref:TRAP transporter large permease n=1 Tax=Oceanobacillus alkalisoli TaxID=2925113 RepID=UPI001F11E9A4|nr:TRAP transporter large permease [Oceanobacillus alkalisoli]MCF3942594.1 TRAP transporter large permease [Oceanobacillus alkalisoli]